MNPLHLKWIEKLTGKQWKHITPTEPVCEECFQNNVLLEEANPLETHDKHEAELVAKAQNTATYQPHSIHVSGSEGDFVTIDKPQTTRYVSFTPLVGIERGSDGKPTEAHKEAFARAKQIIDSYSWNGDAVDPLKPQRNPEHTLKKIDDPTSEHHGKWAIMGKEKKGTRKVLSVHETENDAKKKLYGGGVLSLGQIDGEQLTSVPHLEKPASIATAGARTMEEHNRDWETHIQGGFDHARHLWENDRGQFKKLAAEGRKLLGGTKIWSVSAKLAKTTAEDPDIENLGIYMPPADSGHIEDKNACSRCTRGCKNSCLSQSGYGGFESTQVARIRRAHVLHMAPAHFAAAMMDEMVDAHKKAQTKGAVVAFRPNATTDEPFHRYWPELFHRDHMEENSRGVRTIKTPELKGSFSYAYTAVPDILKGFSNSTFSFKENNEYEGVQHLMKDSRHNSWLPLTTENPDELPHGIIFKVTKRDGSVEHVVAPTTNGDKRDDRPNDHWKSLQEPHVPKIREALQNHPEFKTTLGTVGVGTTKLPIDPEEAQRVKTVGAKTNFLKDINSRPPQEVLDKLPESIKGLRWNYVHVKEPERKVSLNVMSESLKQRLQESLYLIEQRLNKIK